MTEKIDERLMESVVSSELKTMDDYVAGIVHQRQAVFGAVEVLNEAKKQLEDARRRVDALKDTVEMKQRILAGVITQMHDTFGDNDAKKIYDEVGKKLGSKIDDAEIEEIR